MPSIRNYNATYDPVHCTFYNYHPGSSMRFDDDTHFFIKKIEFYMSAEDAKLDRNGTVIDLSSGSAAKRTLFLDQDTYAGLFGCSEFDSQELALSMKQSGANGHMADYGSRVKFSLRMKSPDILKRGQSYMTVTYKTNIKATSAKISLMLENYRGNRIILEPDILDSKGKYVKTKPINIHVFDDPKQDYFGRLTTLRHRNSDFTNGVLLFLAPSKDTGGHAHPQIELLCNQGDPITVFVHSTKCTMNRGDVIIIPSMCAHSIIYENNSHAPCSIKFQPEYLHAYGVPQNAMRSFIAAWQEQTRHDPLITAKELHELGLDKTFEELIHILNSPSFVHYIHVHAKLLTIFTMLLERYNTANTVMFNNGTLSTPFDRVIEEAQKKLSDFTVSDAAKFCNLSFNYFCTSFKKAYGMSFSAYLLSLRLNEAKRLLLTTEMSITDVAMTTGFTDASYFIKKFKLAYNLTPNQFRSNMQYTD